MGDPIQGSKGVLIQGSKGDLFEGFRVVWGPGVTQLKGLGCLRGCPNGGVQG